MPIRDIFSVIEPDHIKGMYNAVKYSKVVGPATQAAEQALGTVPRRIKLLARKGAKTVGEGKDFLAQKAYQMKIGNFDPLHGGIAEGEPDINFDPKSLEQGMKVEKEHTVYKNIQKRIAKDHLKEDPKYYLKLKKMEHGKKN